MNYNVGQRIGVKINGILISGSVTALDAWEAQILLDDGRRFTAELDQLLLPEFPDSDQNLADMFVHTHRGFTAEMGDDRDFLSALDNKHVSKMTIDKSFRVVYSLRKEVTSTLPLRFRIIKTISVFEDEFASLSMTDWKYAVGDAGFSVNGGELECSGIDTALLVPTYPAYRWNAHGIEFQIKNIAESRITLGALIEGGVLYLDIVSGSYADLYFKDDVVGDTLIERRTFVTTFAADDVLTMLDNQRMITLYKNGEIFATFTAPTPGAVKSTWGFWNDPAYEIDSFKLIARAQQVSSFPLGLIYNVRTLPYVPPAVPQALIDKIRAMDANYVP